MIDWNQLFDLAMPQIMSDFRKKGRNYASITFKRKEENVIVADATTKTATSGSFHTMFFPFKFLADNVAPRKLKNLSYYDELMKLIGDAK